MKDTDDNILCKIKNSQFQYRKNTVLDVNDKILFTFQERKNPSFSDWGRQFYEIKNDANDVIGKINMKREKHTIDFFLTTLDGDEILTTKMPYGYKPFEIKDTEGKVIVTVSKISENFLQDLFGKKWNIRIEKLSYDRIILMGFLLSIFHSMCGWGGG